MEDLSFKGNDPGAVRFGNFINYYQFHSPESRIGSLPIDAWNCEDDKNKKCAVLDIGCNSGDLTVALHSFLLKNTNWKNVDTLGVDLDENLILRASEKNCDGVTFKCLDIMSEDAAQTLDAYLNTFHKTRFDVVFCFSTTMWIHLNFGDEGLKTFLKFLCDKSNILMIEPQPWKCYRNAVRRMKKSSQVFPLYPDLKIRFDVDQMIQNLILQDGNFECVFETTSSDWMRKCLLFKRCSFLSK